MSSDIDVIKTVENAHAVFQSGIWSRAPVHHRSTILSRLAFALEKRVREMAAIDSLQTGRTIREMNAQIGRLPEWLSVWLIGHTCI